MFTSLHHGHIEARRKSIYDIVLCAANTAAGGMLEESVPACVPKALTNGDVTVNISSFPNRQHRKYILSLRATGIENAHPTDQHGATCRKDDVGLRRLQQDCRALHPTALRLSERVRCIHHRH